MNIAFVSAVFPYPLHSGGQVRIYNLLKRLSAFHSITLYTFIRKESDLEYLSELSFCKKVVPIYRGRAWQLSYILRSLFSWWPFLYATYKNSALHDALQKDMNSFDLIHIEPSYVYASIPDTNTPIVVCEHNIEHSVYEGFIKTFWFSPIRTLLAFDVLKMKQWEAKIWAKSSSIITVSGEDKVYIETCAPTKKVVTVPNGVDIHFFKNSAKPTISKTSLKFLYIGNFSWIQNTDAIKYILHSIWPTIAKKYPAATFNIVGKHFPEYLRKNLLPSVIIEDDVADIRTSYARADILLAPIRVGGGTRYKILEAMATGVPVITTALGASGLNATHTKELYIADSLSETISSIEALCDKNIRAKLIRNARKHIEEFFSWDSIAKIQDVEWRSV